MAEEVIVSSPISEGGHGRDKETDIPMHLKIPSRGNDMTSPTTINDMHVYTTEANEEEQPHKVLETETTEANEEEQPHKILETETEIHDVSQVEEGIQNVQTEQIPDMEELEVASETKGEQQASHEGIVEDMSQPPTQVSMFSMDMDREDSYKKPDVAASKTEKKERLLKESRRSTGQLLKALDVAKEPVPKQGQEPIPAFSKTPLKAFSASGTVSYEVFKKSGGIRCIVTALRKYCEDAAVLQYASESLGIFAVFDDKAIFEMMTAGAVDGVISAMKSCETLQENAKVSALKLLRALTQKEDNREQIAQSGGTEAVVEMMTHENSQLQERVLSHAALLLSNLAFGNKIIKNKVGSVGGIAAIAKAMSVHPEQQTMQARGSLALRNLCFSSEENQRVGGQCGAIEALIGAVRLHGNDREIVHQSCVALVNISNESPENRGRIVTAGGASAFIGLMKRYSESMTVHDDCIAVLRNIVVESKEAQEEIGKIGGISLIMQSLNKFKKDEQLCTKGCAALRYLCFQPDNRQRVGDNKGMETIVNVLKLHKRSAAAVENALLSIGNATFENDLNKTFVSQCSGLLAILTAVEQHRLNPTIQEHGCRVMRNLVADSKINAARAVENGALIAGVFAMMGFADNASVQEQACAMLVNMTDCDGVIEKFHQADVMRLAQRAMANHTKHRGVQLQAGVLIDRLNGHELITPRNNSNKGKAKKGTGKGDFEGGEGDESEGGSRTSKKIQVRSKFSWPFRKQ